MFQEWVVEFEKNKLKEQSEPDKMFEALGYDEKHYYKEIELYRDSKKCNCIQFDTLNKTFCKFNENDSADILDFSLEELQAINKKVEELGWNES